MLEWRRWSATLLGLLADQRKIHAFAVPIEHWVSWEAGAICCGQTGTWRIAGRLIHPCWTSFNLRKRFSVTQAIGFEIKSSVNKWYIFPFAFAIEEGSPEKRKIFIIMQPIHLKPALGLNKSLLEHMFLDSVRNIVLCRLNKRLIKLHADTWGHRKTILFISNRIQTDSFLWYR